MLLRRALAAALATLAVAFGAQAAAGVGIFIKFADSADELPQDEIREAVTRELTHRPEGGIDVSGELEIAVQGQQLFVRFHGARGYSGRVLPLPEERAQIPVILALVAGNLARDQTPAVVALPDEPAEVPVAPSPRSPTPEERAEDAALLAPVARKQPELPYRRHYFGLHFAQDLTVVSGKNVCDIGTAPYHGFHCFYPDSEQGFDHAVDPTEDDIHPTFVAATTRLLASYDLALIPELTVGVRVGFALRGGPPVPKIPDGPGASTGTPFFPGHIEVRVSYWLAPLTNPAFRGFIGLGAGAAEVDAKVRHTVRDCNLVAAAADVSVDPTDREDAYFACREGLPATDPFNNPVNASVDVWKKAGRAFVGIHGGTFAAVGQSVSLAADMNLLFMLPEYAFVFEPSLGFVYAP